MVPSLTELGWLLAIRIQSPRCGSAPAASSNGLPRERSDHAARRQSTTAATIFTAAHLARAMALTQRELFLTPLVLAEQDPQQKRVGGPAWCGSYPLSAAAAAYRLHAPAKLIIMDPTR